MCPVVTASLELKIEPGLTIDICTQSCIYGWRLEACGRMILLKEKMSNESRWDLKMSNCLCPLDPKSSYPDRFRK